MWELVHEEDTTASPEAVWSVWSDLAAWPEWDATLVSVTLDGEFASGSFARLKPKGAKEIAMELLDVDPPNGFADLQLLPGAKMRTEHTVVAADGGGSVVRQRVTFSGPMARIFTFVIGRGLKRDMPAAMRNLVARAEAA
jgi:uncharacterized membrane protein